MAAEPSKRGSAAFCRWPEYLWRVFAEVLMKKVLVLGAGRSSVSLIEYLLQHAGSDGFKVVVADAQREQAHQKLGGHPDGEAVALDAAQAEERRTLIASAEVVVSLLPPALHVEVARDCLELGKHLITASYTSEAIRALDAEVRRRGLLFMNELGLDPGIDHMSAVERIRHIQHQGGQVKAFFSATGGLVAPESDDNPWHYKFSWNPRNVVLAGQGTAQYLEEGRLRLIPYHRLFEQHRTIRVPGMGEWEVYANRDSLQYRQAYGLQHAHTLFRGTIRHTGFCDGWNALVRLGLTDAQFVIPDGENLSYADLVEALLGTHRSAGTLQQQVARLLRIDPDGAVMRQLEWLGLFEHRPIGIRNASPALALEQLLLEKWTLRPDDRDMVIMQHRFEYTLRGKDRRLTSTLIAKGENATHTAMARLVGLPAAIFARRILNGQPTLTGVRIPTDPETYEPILAELAALGVRFVEEEE